MALGRAVERLEACLLRASRGALPPQLAALSSLWGCQAAPPHARQSSPFSSAAAPLPSLADFEAAGPAPGAGRCQGAGRPAFSLSWLRWMAVPKRKVSPHRRGMRNANKFYRPVTVMARCSKCARVMHAHQVPHHFCKDEQCPSRLQGPGG